MIDTLPKEIQNKIFYYIGGDVTENDILFQKKFIKTKKRVNEYGRLNMQSFNLGWKVMSHTISRRLLTELTKAHDEHSDWCKVLFYHIKRDRTGITIGELIEYLMFCFCD